MSRVNSIVASYEKLIKDKVLQFNPRQKQIVLQLSLLLPIKPLSFFSRFKSNTKQGFYLYGSVGTGKSMLMNLFYDSINHHQNDNSNHGHFKHRAHYNSFMTNIHSRMFEIRSKQSKIKNPMNHIVKNILSKDYQVLCLDEFQVVDIADAMVLRSFIEEYLNLGGFLAITSNRIPNELYKNGIQRSSFLPCIDLLEKRLLVLNLDSGRDFRQRDDASGSHFLSPFTLENSNAFKAKFQELSQSISKDNVIYNYERAIRIHESASNGIAYFDFEELCGTNLGASDYQVISQHYHTIFIDKVKAFTKWEQRDELRRFITLIDVIYDMKVKLAMLMECDLDDLFQFEARPPSEALINTSYGNDGIKHQDDEKRFSLFTGEEELFAIKRTISRLREMQTDRWWNNGSDSIGDNDKGN